MIVVPGSYGRNSTKVYEHHKKKQDSRLIESHSLKGICTWSTTLYRITRKGETMNISIESSNEILVTMFQDTTEPAEQNKILAILFTKNLSLMKKIANRYSEFESIEDLSQEGFFGLRVAAELYDRNMETAFITYAYTWIRQAMKRYIDNCGSCVRLPSNRRDMVFKYSKIVNNFIMEFGRKPSDLELVKLLGISQEQLERLKTDRINIKLRSLDEPLTNNEGEPFSLGDTIADKHDYIGNVIEVDYTDRLKLVLWDEVAKLGMMEQDILREIYVKRKTLQEAADNLGITINDARTAEARAMRNLRRNMVLRPYRNDVLEANAFHKMGISSFLRNHTSVTEQAALKDVKSKRTTRPY